MLSIIHLVNLKVNLLGLVKKFFVHQSVAGFEPLIAGSIVGCSTTVLLITISRILFKNSFIDQSIDGWEIERMYGTMDGQTDRQTDRQTEKHIERQGQR
jgi:hypothetical protein